MNKKCIAVLKKDLVLGKKKMIGFAVIMAAFAAIAALVRLSMLYGNLAPFYEKISSDSFFLNLINIASLAIFVFLLFFFVLSIQNIFSLSFLDDIKCKWDKFSITLPYSAKTVVGTKTAAVVVSGLILIPLGSAMGALMSLIFDFKLTALYFEILFLLSALVIIYSMITMAITMIIKNYNMAGFLSFIPMLPVYIPILMKMNTIREESVLAFSQLRPDLGTDDELIIMDTDDLEIFLEIAADKAKAAVTGLTQGWWWAIILGVIAVTAVTYIIMVKQLERRV